MKTIELKTGRYTKDGINYSIRREESDTQRAGQYAEENGYGVRTHEEVRFSVALKQKLGAIAKARYEQEMGGFQLPAEQGGMFVRTDPRNRTLLVSAALKATSDPAYEVENWKTSEGTFITLTNAMILLLNAAVHEFIAASFAQEAQLSAAIDAATTTEELAAINWGNES